MPDRKDKKPVTDPSILAELNAGDADVQTAPKRKLVVDPSILAELNSDENTPQKKSPVESEPSLAAPSPNGQNGVSENQPAAPNFFDRLISTAKATLQPPVVPSTPVSTQPIQYAESANQPVQSAGEMKSIIAPKYVPQPVPDVRQAVEHVANDYMQNKGHEGVVDVTNPEGDPTALSNYIKTRFADMNARDPSHALAHTKESDDLLNNAGYLLKSQLAVQEYRNKKLTAPDAPKKIESLEEQEKYELLHSDPNQKGAIELKYAELKKGVVQNEDYNPIKLGMKLAIGLGDKTAERDYTKYLQGRKIDEQRKVAYEYGGYDAMQTGAKMAKERGQDDVAEDLTKHSDNPSERLEKNNPKYFRKIWGSQLGDYVYKNEDNPLYGSIFTRAPLTKEEIKKYGEKAGLPKYQIDQLKPEDVPTAASWYGQAAQSTFNTLLLKDENSVGGKIFTGEMPIAQKTGHDIKSILGEVSSGAGMIAGFMVQGGLTGTVLKGAGVFGDVAANARRYETSANLLPIAAANYNDAYKKSEQVIGDEPEDAVKRGIYTATVGTLATAIMSISPATALGRQAIENTISKDIASMLKKTSTEALTKEQLQSTIEKSLQKYAKVAGVTAEHMGTQAFLMSSNKVAENVANMIFDPSHRHDAMDGVADAALHASISMFLPSAMAGWKSRKANTPLNREMAYDIGANSSKYLDQVNSDLAANKITPEDAQFIHEGILGMKDAIAKTPIENIDREQLTEEQRREYSFNLFQQQQLHKELEKVKANTQSEGASEDKSQTGPIDARIKELVKANDEILSDAGKEVEVKQPMSLLPEEPNQAPADERSVATDLSSEPITPAAKEKKEKVVNTEKENIPLIPQEDNTSKNNDHDSKQSNERGQNNTSNEETKGSEDQARVRQAANGEGRNEQEDNRRLTREEKKAQARAEIKAAKEANSPEAKSGEIPVVKKEEKKLNSDVTVETPHAKIEGHYGDKLQGEEGEINLPKPGLFISDANLKEGAEKGKGRGQEVYQKALDEYGTIYSHSPVSEDALRVQNKLVEKGFATISEKEIGGKAFRVIEKPKEKSNQGTEPSTERRNEAKSEPPASANKDFTPPQPEKPLHEMTGQELSDYHDKLKKHNKDLDKNILGEKYDEYQKAQRTSETPTASKEAREAAHKTINEIEDALAPEQRKALFSEGLPEGTIVNESEVKEYQNKVEHVEASANESELARSISNSLIDLNNAPRDTDKMTAKQKQALSAMIAAKRVIEERGYDGKKVTQDALKTAASKFSDQSDAEFMLSKYLDFKQQKPQENASTQSKKQLKEGNKQSGRPEHARVEQAGSKAKAAEAKNSNIIQRSQAETPVKAETIIRNIGEYKIADAFGNIPKAKPSLFVQKGDWHYPLKKSMDAEKVIKKHESGNLEILRIGEIRNVIKEAFPDADEKNAMSGTIYMTANGKTIRISDHNENSNASRGESDLYFYAGQTTKNKIISELKDKVPVELKGEKSNQAPADERSVATNPSSEPPASAPKELSLVEKKTLALNNLKTQHDDLNFQKEELETKLDNAYAKSKVDPAEVEDLEKQIAEKRQEISAKKNALDMKAREVEIQKEYAKNAEKARKAVDKLIGDKKALSSVIPFLNGETVRSVLKHAIDLYEQFGNLHIAAFRALEWAKEKFHGEKGIEELGESHIKDLIEPHTEPLVHEPVIQDKEHLDLAKKVLQYIQDDVLTYEEVRQDILDAEGLYNKTKGKILNYVDWHLASEETTSIRNATTRIRREQYGLNEEIPAAKKEFGETWEEAKDKIEHGYNPQDLIDGLVKHPRPLTDVENAIILHHQNKKEVELHNLNKDINKAAEEGNTDATIEAKVAKARVLDELQRIYDVNKAVGTENARGLASRRMMADRKYSLVNMIAEKRATSNDGQPLTEEQQAHIESLHQKIHETQEAFDKYVKQKEADILELQRKVLAAQQEKAERKAAAGKENPNASEVEKKQTASKKVADKLRSWADKIEKSTKNQAYSSPIPVTPKMVADALRFVAEGVEKGGEILDYVQQAIGKLRTAHPGIDESHLEREINQALIDAGVAQQSGDVSSRISKIKLMSPFFKDGKLDREATRLNVAANRAKAEFDHDILREKEKQLSKVAKFQNAFVKWQRMFKLSNPITLGKLAMAGMTRLATTPLEDIVGGAASKIFPQLAKGAIGEGGGLHVNETAKAYKEGLMLGMKDARQVVKWRGDGKSDLDVLFGKSGDLPPEAIDFFGQLHSAIKAPFKRIIFERQLEKRLRRNLANGVDISDPMVQTSIMTDAYKDANRAIFMQDNTVADGWRKLINHFDNVDPRTGKAPSKIIATTMQWMVPFVKVPTNIVAETARGIYGLPVGAAQALHATFTNGIEKLSPDQKDIILRNLKKGTLGAAALALGYFNAQNFGGYYQQGQKRKEEDPEALGLRLFGIKMPAWFFESPIFQIMQFGATVKKVQDKYIHGEKNDISDGLMAGLTGIVDHVPMASQPMRMSSLFKSKSDREYYWGELMKSTVDPALISYLARVTDPADEGSVLGKIIAPENKRKTPKTTWEHIKSGIPGLREDLPEK